MAAPFTTPTWVALLLKSCRSDLQERPGTKLWLLDDDSEKFGITTHTLGASLLAILRQSVERTAAPASSRWTGS